MFARLEYYMRSKTFTWGSISFTKCRTRFVISVESSNPANQFRFLWDMADRSHVSRLRRELKLRSATSASVEQHGQTRSNWISFSISSKYFWQL